MRQFATNPTSCNYKMLFIKLSFNLNLLPNLGSVTEWRTNGHTCALARGLTEDLREGNLIFTFLYRRSRGDTHYTVLSSNVLPTSNLPSQPLPVSQSGSCLAIQGVGDVLLTNLFEGLPPNDPPVLAWGTIQDLLVKTHFVVPAGYIIIFSVNPTWYFTKTLLTLHRHSNYLLLLFLQSSH